MSKSDRKFHILPDSTGYGLAVILLGFAEVLFLLFVLALDVLPFKFIAAIILILILADVLVLWLLGSRKKHSLKHIVGLIIVVLLLNVLLIGDYYIYNTYDTLQKISKKEATWEFYDVVTLKEGSYNTVDSINGQNVVVTSMTSKQLTEARERLITKADVTYTEEPDFATTGYHLVDQDGQMHDEIILISKTQYQLLKKQVKGFRKNTQCIFKLKVKKRADDTSKRVDVTKDSFNVLISGIDSWGKISDGGLSDVNMVMTVNPETREVLLTSIPRDSYIVFHSYGARDKLTHSAVYGEEETKQTIEDFLGIDINYTLKVNFSMLVDIIDAIDGVYVYNDVDFYSHPKGWHYKKGKILLTGHYALWFARERKSFLDGDMKRNENQQKVLKATIQKVTNSKVIMTRYTSILNAVEDEMITDLSEKDLKRLAKMQLKDMHKWTINTINIKGSTGGAPCFSMGGQELSVVFPDEETVAAAKEAIHDTMYPVDNSKKKNGKKKVKSDEKSN